MQAVKTLWIVLTLLFISGCSPQPGISKCVTPSVKYPDINNTDCGKNNKCIYEKVVGNYYKMQEYSEKLYNANQVCK